MELKDFIKNALVSIVEGVDEANSLHNRFELSSGYHAEKRMNGSDIAFDISIVVDESKEENKKAGASLKVVSLLTGELSGEDKTKAQNQSIQKLAFKIFIKEK